MKGIMFILFGIASVVYAIVLLSVPACLTVLETTRLGVILTGGVSVSILGSILVTNS